MQSNPSSTSTPTLVPRPKPRPPISRVSRVDILSPIPCHSNGNMANSVANHENIQCRNVENRSKISLDKSNIEQHSSEESSFSFEEENENSVDKYEIILEGAVRTAVPHISGKQADRQKTPDIHEKEANLKTFSKKDRSVNDDIIVNKNVFTTSNILYVIISAIILYCIVYAFNPIEINRDPEVTINALKKYFPRQDDKFWLFIESGVSEIINFDKPSVIVLTYTSKTSKITDKLLGHVSRYASCILNNNCTIEPILISGKDLDTHDFRKDYGILIDRYGSQLEQSHIMIVKDIDEISGTVAQAFHSFCDEYSPLVKRALFLFTVRVDEFYDKALKQVVDILQRKWSDVDYDKLESLITRVSSIVLQIK